MTAELKLLVASVVLGLVHLIASSHLISWQRGYRWTASNREEPAPPLRGLANRVDQATTNFLETFPLFATVVLAAHITSRDSPLTLWVRTSTSGRVLDICSRRQLDTVLCVRFSSGIQRLRVYCSSSLRFFGSQMKTLTNRSKPTAPLRNQFSVLVTTPCRGLSRSR